MGKNLILIVFILVSCNNENGVMPSGITLSKAQSEQIISFEIGERKIQLTEFKKDAWPFHGTIVQTNDIDFNLSLHYPVSRAIYASIPEDQALENHIETFGIEFNSLFLKNELDLNSNKILNAEKFRSGFLKRGNRISSFPILDFIKLIL